MKFSVLLSVYNGENAENLKEALQSIINQSRKPNQIVIIKDGKLNEQLEQTIKNIYDKYPDIIKTYGYEENKGLGYALQKGITICDYEYVARMDSDDIALEDRFKIQMEYLEKHPDIDVLGGYIQEYDEEMKIKKAIRKVPLSNEEIYKNIGKQSPFNHSTVVLRKQAVIEVGNYPNQKIEDYLLWIKMCLNKCKMANVPNVLVNFRTSKDMYKRRTGIKYLKAIKKVEDTLLQYKLINKLQYAKNILTRAILATIPARIKMYIYPKIVRKV